MTFGGKTGLSGFYSTVQHRLNDESTSFQQQVDMVKLLNYGQIWNIIGSQDLLHMQKDTSSFLKIELDRIARETRLISDVRGYGTHLGFDCQNADIMHRWFMRTGINIHRCGPTSFAMRPSLTLGVNDAAQLRESFLNYHPNFENNY